MQQSNGSLPRARFPALLALLGLCPRLAIPLLQIRVFCRIRPNPRSAVQALPDGFSVRLPGPDGKDHTFTYDKVFKPEASQVSCQHEELGRGRACSTEAFWSMARAPAKQRRGLQEQAWLVGMPSASWPCLLPECCRRPPCLRR